MKITFFEIKMVKSYNSVVGNNYESDLTKYEEISTNTIKLAREFLFITKKTHIFPNVIYQTTF